MEVSLTVLISGGLVIFCLGGLCGWKFRMYQEIQDLVESVGIKSSVDRAFTEKNKYQ